VLHLAWGVCAPRSSCLHTGQPFKPTRHMVIQKPPQGERCVKNLRGKNTPNCTNYTGASGGTDICTAHGFVRALQAQEQSNRTYTIWGYSSDLLTLLRASMACMSYPIELHYFECCSVLRAPLFCLSALFEILENISCATHSLIITVCAVLDRPHQEICMSLQTHGAGSRTQAQVQLFTENLQPSHRT
jgi:hypothetical protein